MSRQSLQIEVGSRCRKLAFMLGLAVMVLQLKTKAETSICSLHAAPGEPVLMYVKGLEEIPADDWRCVTATLDQTTCEVTEGLVAADSRMHFRTAVMIDNSLSIKKENREKIIELTQKIIRGHAVREEFILYTFSTELHQIAGGTDYESLSTAADGITFTDQDAYLVDCLMDLLDYLEQNRHFSYDRIILMSDGVDDNEAGRSYIDLMVMLEEGRYRCPVYPVISIWEKNTSGLKDLQALSGVLQTDAFFLDKIDDLSLITAAMTADYNARWFQISVPPNEGDGSTKTITLHIPTADGQDELVCSVHIPELTQEETRTEEQINTETEVLSRTGSETAGSLAEKGRINRFAAFDHDDRFLWLASGIAAVLAGLVILAAVVPPGKKKKTDRSFISGINEDVAAGIRSDCELTEDEFGGYSAVGGMTVAMWRNDRPPGCGKKLILTDVLHDDRYYSFILKDEAVVGRNQVCSVVINNDSTISGRHCRIYLRDMGTVMVEDLHSYNGTMINGELIRKPERIRNGDELKLGATRVKVSIL